MWTKALIICYPVHLKSHRAHAWAIWHYERAYMCIQDCEVTPEGWIIYELWEALGEWNEYAYRSWHSEKKLLLIDEGVMETYTLDDDEYYEFPSMPRNWAIPF